MGFLCACTGAPPLTAVLVNTPPTSEHHVPVDPNTVATLVVRHADGTPADGAEVALAVCGDWSQVAPVRGRTDVEGRVVLPCVTDCRVAAWTRDPPAVWLEPHVWGTYVVPGSTSELRLTAVAFAALDVQPPMPCYVTHVDSGSHMHVPPLPGLLSDGPATVGGWRYLMAPHPEVAPRPLKVRLQAAELATTTVDLTPGPARDGAPVVVDLSTLAPRPWAAPRLEVALPNGELLGAAATELVRCALWLYDKQAREGYFPSQVRNGEPGRIRVPAGRYVVRTMLDEFPELWSGPIEADTDTLRIVLTKDRRPVEVTLRGLLAYSVNIVVQVNGTVHRAGVAHGTLFGQAAGGVGDPTADAETSRVVLMVPPGDLTISLQESNSPHRPIGAPQPLRVDAAPAAAPARVTFDVPPR